MKLNVKLATKIKDICARSIDTKIDVALGYKTMKLIKSIEDGEEFYNTKLTSIIEKYAEKDETGNYIQLDNGNLKIIEGMEEACQADMDELEELELEIPDWIDFNFNELGQLQCTPRELFYFDPLIKQ